MRIILLGEVSLELMDGTPVPPELLQPRKLALLALLAAENRPLTREEITAILWRDSPGPRARASLSQLLHSIRRDCRVDPFALVGKSVSLRQEAVTCDIQDFYCAVKEESPEDVLRRFNGSFMPGFSLAGENAFEDWCSAQRERHDLNVADLAWQAAERSGPTRAALEFLQLAAQVRPWDETILRKRLRVLDQLGERTTAIALYERYSNLVRTELGTVPGSATQDLYSELTSAAAGNPAPAQPAPNTPTVQPKAAAPAWPKLRIPHRWAVRMAAPLVLVLAAFAGVMMSRQASGGEQGRPTLMVGDLLITGGVAERRKDISDRITTILARDTTFALVERGMADLTLAGAIRLEEDGSRGELRLSFADGSGIATVPLGYPATSDVAMVHDLAERIRNEVRSIRANDEESRLLAHVHSRIAEAGALGDRGAFVVGEGVLDALEKTVASNRVSERLALTSASLIAEQRGWYQLWQGDRPGALAYFQNAIRDAENDGASTSPQRLADLHYFMWAVESPAGAEHLSKAIDYIEQIPQGERTADAWARLAAALYGLGHYADSYGAANAARMQAHPSSVDRELSLILFQSAFNDYKDVTATSECNNIRAFLPTSWPAVACAAMLAGWSNAPYSLPDLQAELNQLEDPEPLRSSVRTQLSLLIAAAGARRGEVVDWGKLPMATPSRADADQKVFLATAMLASGRTSEAAAIISDLSTTIGGQRARLQYARLLGS